jgi:hypothetical protein
VGTYRLGRTFCPSRPADFCTPYRLSNPVSLEASQETSELCQSQCQATLSSRSLSPTPSSFAGPHDVVVTVVIVMRNANVPVDKLIPGKILFAALVLILFESVKTQTGAPKSEQARDNLDHGRATGPFASSTVLRVLRFADVLQQLCLDDETEEGVNWRH